jgi:hypothetical protein
VAVDQTRHVALNHWFRLPSLKSGEKHHKRFKGFWTKTRSRPARVSDDQEGVHPPGRSLLCPPIGGKTLARRLTKPASLFACCSTSSTRTRTKVPQLSLTAFPKSGRAACILSVAGVRAKPGILDHPFPLICSESTGTQKRALRVLIRSAGALEVLIPTFQKERIARRV